MKNLKENKIFKLFVMIAVLMFIFYKMGWLERNVDPFDTFKKTTAPRSAQVEASEGTQELPVTAEEKAMVSITKLSEVARTQYFDVMIENVSLEDGFGPLKKEDGSRYVVMDVTVKNTNTETRFMGSGVVVIYHNKKALYYEKEETVLFEKGWGIIGDINPLCTKKGRVAYKIPYEVEGPVFYIPSRGNDAVIHIGNIVN